MTSAAIDVANLTKSYNRGRVHALNDVSLSVQPGEVFGLLGPNGAGKSTLMGILLGLLIPSSGNIHVLGRSAYELSVRQVTGYLPERPYFDAWMTPAQFLRYHHMLARRPDAEAKEAVAAALQRVELDPSFWHRQIKKLSRGTLQRLGLAQVLIGRPQIIFLDEPDSGMDPLGTALVRSLIGEWKSMGCTVLVNSHHLDEVEKTCDRVAFIKKGKIIAVRNLAEENVTEQFMRFRWSVVSQGETDKAKRLIASFATKYGATTKEANGSSAVVLLPERALATDMVRDLVQSGVKLQEAIIEKQSLENIFVRLHQDEDS